MKLRLIILLAAMLATAPTISDASTHHKLHHHRIIHHKAAAIDSTPIVWVNTNSGVYHYEGERWYGNSEEGEYLHEDVAIKDGFRATENGQ